jgi:hypothetical protein
LTHCRLRQRLKFVAAVLQRCRVLKSGDECVSSVDSVLRGLQLSHARLLKKFGQTYLHN